VNAISYTLGQVVLKRLLRVGLTLDLAGIALILMINATLVYLVRE
jgi:hypothetical protein